MSSKQSFPLLKALSAARAWLAGCVLMLGCLGISGAWAQALPQITMLDSLAGGPHPGDGFKIWNVCDAIGATETTSTAQTITIFPNAQQGDLLHDWIPISLPGWRCHRYYQVGSNGTGLQLPICGGQSTCYVDGVLTYMRHWLEGYLSPAHAVQAGTVNSDGHSYRVFQNPAWTGSHPMAPFGFIVRWSANINGDDLERPVSTEAPDPTGVFGLQEWGPSVDTIVPSQHTFNNNDYQITEVTAAFRLVLLDASPANVNNSDGNLFYITQGLRSGMDNCAQFYTLSAPCIFSDSGTFNSFSYQALVNIQRSMPTCTAEDVTVTFDTLVTDQFPQQGSVAGLRPFTVELKNCTHAFNIGYKLLAATSGPPSPDPTLGLIPLNQGQSTATGMDVQVLDDNQDPHPLDDLRIIYSWSGQGPPPAVPSLQIPLYAQLRRRGAPLVTPGHYTAAATVVIEYP